MRQPARELFHCAKIIYGSQPNTIILAQWTHEAAHEGRARFMETVCIKGIKKDPGIKKT